jgi:hypothetical protein
MYVCIALIDTKETVSTIPMDELKRLRKHCADLSAQVRTHKVYVCTYVCMYVCVLIYILRLFKYLYTYTHTYIHTYIQRRNLFL